MCAETASWIPCPNFPLNSPVGRRVFFPRAGGEIFPFLLCASLKDVFPLRSLRSLARPSVLRPADEGS